MCFIQINLLHLTFPLSFCLCVYLFVSVNKQHQETFVCVVEGPCVSSCHVCFSLYFAVLHVAVSVSVPQSQGVNLFKVFPNFSFFFFSGVSLKVVSCFLFAICLSLFWIHIHPFALFIFLSSPLPTFKLHLLFLRSLYASTFISTLIHKLSWLGLTLEITCRVDHSSCLILSSNVWNIFSFAFLSSSLPSFCVRVNKKV